jgi:hypothetical protein
MIRLRGSLIYLYLMVGAALLLGPGSGVKTVAGIYLGPC